MQLEPPKISPYYLMQIGIICGAITGVARAATSYGTKRGVRYRSYIATTTKSTKIRANLADATHGIMGVATVPSAKRVHF